MATVTRDTSAPERIFGLLSRFGGRALAVVTLLVLVPLAWLSPIDSQADAYVQKGLKQALITFGVARTANAVISLAQESTVSVSASVVVGGSATVALGQVLDPINDLVESFSNLMLAACISFAMQAALLEIGKTTAVSASMTLLLVGWALARWLGRAPPMWLAKGLVLLLIARFAVPVAALGSEMTYQTLLGAKHRADQARLAVTTGEMESQAKQLGATGWREYLDPNVWKAFIDSAKRRAEGWVENAIRVMAVFVVQTVVLPLLFFWLVVWLARELFGWRAPIPAISQPRSLSTLGPGPSPQ